MISSSPQAFAALAINAAGIIILIWILVLVRGQNRKFKELGSQIKLLEKARKDQEDK